MARSLRFGSHAEYTRLKLFSPHHCRKVTWLNLTCQWGTTLRTSCMRRLKMPELTATQIMSIVLWHCAMSLWMWSKKYHGHNLNNYQKTRPSSLCVHVLLYHIAFIQHGKLTDGSEFDTYKAMSRVTVYLMMWAVELCLLGKTFCIVNAVDGYVSQSIFCFQQLCTTWMPNLWICWTDSVTLFQIIPAQEHDTTLAEELLRRASGESVPLPTIPSTSPPLWYWRQTTTTLWKTHRQEQTPLTALTLAH